MPTVSYAENWEDILLCRVFAPGHSGFYIDVGDGSITRLFAERGWTGINVAADAESFERLRGERPRDVNLPEFTTLADVCESHADRDIDFLVVGRPGRERDVLDGGDWHRWRPRVVLVKVDRHGEPDAHEAWEKALLDADYAFAAFNGSTRFYVRGEDRDLLAALATPVNAFDDFLPSPHATAQAQLQRDLAAARAVNESMRTLYAGVEELDALRAQTASLEAAAASIQAQCEETRALMADALSRYEQLRRDVIQTRIEVEAAQSVFRSVGPAGMAVAQKLAQASLRFPAAGSVAKRSARAGKWLRRALHLGR